ncbi:hypothetical protein [Labrys neptuniae]
MPINRTLADGLVFVFLASATALLLDQPSDAEATAAKQQRTAHINTCVPAVGRPGVTCTATVKDTPQAQASPVRIYFARGPDSAWIAEILH